MKLAILLFILLIFGSGAMPIGVSCDIAEVYSPYTPERGTLAILGYGNIEEVTKLLIPTTLNEGKYSVTLSREGNDVYKIEGRDIYLKTRYCSPPTGEEVILVWKSNYAYTKGTIISTD